MKPIHALAFAAGLAICIPASAARSQTLIEEWSTAKLPAPPALKPAELDAKETAVLAMDFTKQTCSPERRKRCADQVATVQKFVAEARAKGALIIYSVAVPNSVPADILPALTPAAGEQVLPPLGPDKFLGSDLEKRLKDKAIKTVIVTGSSAQGVVIGTGSGAAQRGYKVIVPVDGMSSDDVYSEQYAAWHMYKGGPAIVTDQVTLTRSDMISF